MMTLRHSHAGDREAEAAAERIGATIPENPGSSLGP